MLEPKIELRPPCKLQVEVADPFDFGTTPAGHRRVINIVGVQARYASIFARSPSGIGTGR